MKINWTECNCIFNREFFEKLAEQITDKTTRYILMKVQDMYKGTPQSYSTKLVLLSIEHTFNGNISGMIGCRQYFEAFDTYYVLDYSIIDD